MTATEKRPKAGSKPGGKSKLPPTPLESALKPDLGTTLIPKERYIGAEYKAAEDQRLWNRVWLMAGFASDLDEPGAFMTCEVGRESVVIVRQTSGEIAVKIAACLVMEFAELLIRDSRFAEGL